VDLPSPLAPTRPICSPFNNLKETSSNIALSPKPCVRCSTYIISHLLNINIVILKSPFPAYTNEKRSLYLDYKHTL